MSEKHLSYNETDRKHGIAQDCVRKLECKYLEEGIEGLAEKILFNKKLLNNYDKNCPTQMKNDMVR